MSKQTIVITGASSGIGKATAKLFASKGWNVAATMRKPEQETELVNVENIKLYQLDVTDKNEIRSATEQILNDFEQVDVLLNNAGYGLMGTMEAATDEQIRHQFDVNVFGLFDVTRAFLPHFRANKDGVIINISSVGGRITFPFMGLYHSTKWAVEGFTESISQEWSELGIRAKIVEPGMINTDFGGRSMTIAQSDSITDYDETFNKMNNNAEKILQNGSEPELVADVIYEAATDGSTKLRYHAGEDAKQMLTQREQVGEENFIAGMKQNLFA